MVSKQRTVSIQTTGCRLNQYESEKIAGRLAPYGFIRVDAGEPADLYIINTCTITYRADSSSRHLIRKAARENPEASIVVAGCYVDSDPEMISGLEGVDAIISNAQKDKIAEILSVRLPDLFASEPEKGCADTIGDFRGHNRAWLGISDGCHQRCSFCILPSVRGDQLRHRAPADILREATNLVSQGFQEICLTGLNIGYYKWTETVQKIKNLSDLSRLILDQTGIRRIRLSSIEPQTVNEDIIKLMLDRRDQICRHLHTSLQSGSSRILRLMRRPYDAEEWVRRVSSVRKSIPKVIIGADIIVGFPGESDEDFAESKAIAESGLVDYLHVFSYSDRPGTDASRLGDKISSRIIKERNAVLTCISHRVKRAAHERQVGETLEVISEFSPTKGRYHCGVADNFIRVRLPEGTGGGKEIVRVKIRAASDGYVIGDPV